MKKPQRSKRAQPPGPDYEFTLGDIRRMVEQLGGRLSLAIYPKELDDPAVPPRPREADETTED